MRILTIACLAAAILACNSHRDLTLSDIPDFCKGIDATDPYSVVDSGGLEIITSFRPVSRRATPLRLASDPILSLGVVEGDSVQEFGRVVDATRLTDGRVVVADAQIAALRVFDSSGSFVRTYGRRGSGPGEYRFIIGLFRTSGDTLWVVDSGNRRVTQLSPDLAVVNTAPLPFIRWSTYTPLAGRVVSGSTPVRIVGILRDRSLIGVNSLNAVSTEEITNASRDSLIVRRIAPDFTRIDSLGLALGNQSYEYFPGDGSVWFGDAPFGYVESLAVGANSYYLGDGYHHEIEKRGSDGRIVQLSRVCESPDVIPPSQLDSFIKASLAGVDSAARTHEEQALRGIPHSSVAPAYLDLVVDERDRLWIRDFTFPGMPRRWKVLSPDGHWLADVEMPSGLTIIEIGSDYLLGRDTTDMGVDRVRMHRLPAI